MEKQKKDILFPTLICLSFANQENLEIIDSEMDKEYLRKYVRNAKKDECLNMLEDDIEYKSIDSSMGKTHSISSTNSSTTSITTDLKMEHCPFVPFSMRFPKNLLEEAYEFYSH